MKAEYGPVPRDIMATTDGLDVLKAIQEGRLPAPPMAGLMGFELSEVEEGRVAFRATPTADHYNPLGTVHGGYAATILDSSMGCAVHSTLKAGQGYTTLEFKVNLVRALTEATGEVTAEGRIIHTGRRTATAEGMLRDSEGRLCAHATTTCLILDL